MPGYFKKDLIEQLNNEVGNALKSGRIHCNYTGRKMFNIHNEIPELRKIIFDKWLLNLISCLMGQEATHCQTINFIKGSEQKAHSDFVHMATAPIGNLIGAWVAMEDINSENGQLTYYPGSHKLPYILNSDYGNSSNAFLLDSNANEKYEEAVAKMISKHGLEEKKLEAKAGDVLVWQANLLHGGAKILNPNATRKSMVSHYLGKESLCYHEISERPAIMKS